MNLARKPRDTAIRAEAASWLARIRSDAATEGDRANFQLWLSEDSRHREAFDAVSAVWEAIGGVGKLAGSAGNRWPEESGGTTVARRALLVGGGVLAVAAGVWGLRNRNASLETYATQIGEQRRVALADGSLAILDTGSQIAVDFDARRRTVRLLAGRTYFEVAHDRAHPFVVEAGARQVVALGTAFDVERRESAVGVLLITGEVLITLSEAVSDQAAVELRSPGEHVVFQEERVVRRDRLDLDVATAWQSGRVIFNEDTLAAAVAEMNRYSRRPIVLVDERASRLKISGNYSTGDTEAFATSLSALLPVTATFEPDRISLAAE